MFLVYYDESGDDGFPGESDLFVLTALSIHDQWYSEGFLAIRNLRKQLKENFNIPVSMELHTRALLLNKKPYTSINICDNDRIKIIDYCIHFLAQQQSKMEFTNVIINKPKIQNKEFDVLDTALKYSIQRIENTLKSKTPGEKFIIITDEGRIEKMRAIARKVQAYNPIPERNGIRYYMQEIKNLVEDPLPKKSDQSYFIQFCDMLSFIISLYMRHVLRINHFPNNLPAIVDQHKLKDWLDTLVPVFNLAANKGNEFGYGIVCYPKK